MIPGDYFLKVHLKEFHQTSPDHGIYDGGDYQLKIRPTILQSLESDRYDVNGKNISLYDIGGKENAPSLGVIEEPSATENIKLFTELRKELPTQFNYDSIPQWVDYYETYKFTLKHTAGLDDYVKVINPPGTSTSQLLYAEVYSNIDDVFPRGWDLGNDEITTTSLSGLAPGTYYIDIKGHHPEGFFGWGDFPVYGNYELEFNGPPHHSIGDRFEVNKANDTLENAT